MSATQNIRQNIRLQRVYEEPAVEDGMRILVDRLWPRGIKKESLQGEWLRDVSPSNELRKWAHSTEDFEGFCARYVEELSAEPAASALERLLQDIRSGSVTLLYATKDEEHNNAVALRRHILTLLAEDE
jgi:uncharacterized protein YeaO (DUF488 family)